MKADAVIFDKDGTLIDFDAFWISVTVNALTKLLKEFNIDQNMVNDILPLLGVKDGKTDIDGVLCKGTYK